MRNKQGNIFKQKLMNGELQIGLWLAMADAYAASIAGHAGFEWLVVDGEHGPNDLRSTLDQLMALEASPSAVVVRPAMGEKWYIKQLLDAGCQTLLIPLVETAGEAEKLVSAVRYPPHGERGMGAFIARASAFGTRHDYVDSADDNICLLVQVETRKGIENLEAIASVEGVDGVFIGPADLAADLGHRGAIGAREVQQEIEAALVKLATIGKPSGILTFDRTLNQRYIELGARFVAVGADVSQFSVALANLRRDYSDDEAAAPMGSY